MFRIMSLDQAIAVQQDTIAWLHGLLVFVVAGPRQHPKRHSCCLELGNPTSRASKWPVVTGVRIAHASGVKIENPVEAGHEHPGGDSAVQQLVDACQHFTGGCFSWAATRSIVHVDAI